MNNKLLVKTARLDVLLEPEIKQSFIEKVKINNSTISTVLRELICSYIEEQKNITQ